MIYSDVLLEAVKSIGLVDDDVDALTRQEKRLYSSYLRNAIAKFNNNPDLSIGTENVFIDNWDRDELGYFKRIVRNEDQNVRQLAENHNHNHSQPNSLHKLIWNGIDGRTMQELPQRLISAVVNNGNVRVKYHIVNAKTFYESGSTEHQVYYEVRENDAIVRISIPKPSHLVFNRAILFPWETKPGESIGLVDGVEQEHDPLDVQIQIPTSHIPFLINLTALEIGMGVKVEKSRIADLRDQLASQEQDLMANNIRDRVKLTYTNQDDAYQWWNRRAYR